uniref:RNA polymerase Rpb2 domain-containing protein n=1 Tax=Triticum aestivum TaxID=4565 RepID=A0A3B5XWX5_WHEAT
MNQRLNLDIPQNNTFLLPRDVLAATDHLIGIKFGMGRSRSMCGVIVVDISLLQVTVKGLTTPLSPPTPRYLWSWS